MSNASILRMMNSLCWIFLHEHHVLLVHGGGFNWQEPDHFRIVYLPNMDDLKANDRKDAGVFSHLSAKISKQ